MALSKELYPDVFMMKDINHGMIKIKKSDKFYNIFKRVTSDPLFYRLSNIKQTPCASDVYNSPSTMRSHHSIGILHITCKYINHLKQQIDIPEIIENTILVAALLHDIGHGPYSHLMDSIIDTKSIYIDNPICPRNCDKRWTHERMSIEILHHLSKKYPDEFKNVDVELAERMITCTKSDYDENYNISEDMLMKDGIKVYEEWMFEIVASIFIDVDKMDYLQRDGTSFGLDNSDLTSSIDIYISKIAIINGRMYIKQTAEPQIMYILQTRARYHNNIYMHPTNKAKELMIEDMILKTYSTEDLKYIVNNLDEYKNFDDNTLMYKFKEKVPKLYDRIITRDLYKLVNKMNLYVKDGEDGETVKRTISGIALETDRDMYTYMNISKIKINHTNGKKDPLLVYRFYTEKDGKKYACKPSSGIQKISFEKHESVFIRFYCKKSHKDERIRCENCVKIGNFIDSMVLTNKLVPEYECMEELVEVGEVGEVVAE